MAVGTDDPAVQRRRLRTDLRKLRLEKDLTQRDVAEVMEWSTSKLIRIENGTVGISANDLRALLSHYGVTSTQKIDEFLERARVARKESWAEFRDVVSPEFVSFLGFESSARTVRQFEPLLVPGLLQTEEYARAVLTDTFQRPPDSVERSWQVRQRRQELHERDDPPRMWFILDEPVIRRKVGSPATMRRQLERLKVWAAAEHITIWVIPFGAGAHAGMRGPFVLLEFAEAADDDLLYLEHSTGSTTTRDNPEETGPYLDLFYELEKLALNQDDSVAMIDSVIDELSRAPKST